MQKKVAVSASIPERADEAQELAVRLHLDYAAYDLPDLSHHYDYILVFTPAYLGLQKTIDKKSPPFHLDFRCGKIRYRHERASFSNELIAKSMGRNKRSCTHIIDATAGLGRDSFILAALGFEVTLIERSAVLYALLEDALMTAKHDISLRPIIERMHLIHMDAAVYLHELKQGPKSILPDIIYLDPMFPPRKKSASIKKDMAIVQDLLGDDDNNESLFHLALTCATRRIVVKRPRLAPPLTGCPPHFSVTGKSSRFDVYLV